MLKHKCNKKVATLKKKGHELNEFRLLQYMTMDNL